MSERIKSLVFAVGMCMACSLLLTAAATGLRERQQANMRLDRQKNLLRSVGLIAAGEKVPAETVQRLYADNIEQVVVNPAGDVVPPDQAGPEALALYLYRPGERIEGYIVPIDTQGLWGKILGYMALKNDGATISGFTVYKHNETPGLGGEIEQALVSEEFRGKADRFPGRRVRLRYHRQGGRGRPAARREADAHRGRYQRRHPDGAVPDGRPATHPQNL